MKYLSFFLIFLILLFSLGNCKDITSPNKTTLVITSPTDGDVVYGNVSVNVKVYDSNISKIILYINSAQKSTKQSSPYDFTIDFSPYDGNTVTVSCNGYDSNGKKVGTSNSISLVVSSTHNNPNPQ